MLSDIGDDGRPLLIKDIDTILGKYLEEYLSNGKITRREVVEAIGKCGGS